MNAVHNVVKNNATFKAYYDAKRAEGRSHYNALGYCAGFYYIDYMRSCSEMSVLWISHNSGKETA